MRSSGSRNRRVPLLAGAVQEGLQASSTNFLQRSKSAACGRNLEFFADERRLISNEDSNDGVEEASDSLVFCCDPKLAPMMLMIKKTEVSRMKFKRMLTMSLLGGAMLALPMAAPTFAQTSYSANPNYIQQVDWWWDHYKADPNAYANRGWHSGYYQYGGQRYACERARGLQSQVWQDRNTGHPAAARDVEQEAAAARANCYNR
jgi:hypothetical protein